MEIYFPNEDDPTRFLCPLLILQFIMYLMVHHAKIVPSHQLLLQNMFPQVQHIPHLLVLHQILIFLISFRKVLIATLVILFKPLSNISISLLPLMILLVLLTLTMFLRPLLKPLIILAGGKLMKFKHWILLEHEIWLHFHQINMLLGFGCQQVITSKLNYDDLSKRLNWWQRDMLKYMVQITNDASSTTFSNQNCSNQPRHTSISTKHILNYSQIQDYWVLSQQFCLWM